MSKKMSYAEMNSLLEELSSSYKIYAPARLEGIGTFSDTDVLRYTEIRSAEEIIYNEKTHFSAKEFVFPITQTLFYYVDENTTVPNIDDQGIILFLRSCDIHSLKVQDTIFLKNGNTADFYYERLRKKVKIFMLECKESFDNCFCVTINTNKTDYYDAAFRFSDNEILCECKSDEFAPLLNNIGIESDFTPEFVQQDAAAVSLPDSDKITKELFHDSLWDEYSKRCIACGRCNFVCPTCTCWTMQDVQYDENQNIGERRRVWAGCHVDKFTDMAGGHSFRKPYGDRMRFKVLHKIYDFKKRFGFHMCVGCGRCDDICPEYISYAKSINKVTRWTEGERQ